MPTTGLQREIAKKDSDKERLAVRVARAKPKLAERFMRRPCRE